MRRQSTLRRPAFKKPAWISIAGRKNNARRMAHAAANSPAAIHAGLTDRSNAVPSGAGASGGVSQFRSSHGIQSPATASQARLQRSAIKTESSIPPKASSANPRKRREGAKRAIGQFTFPDYHCADQL